MISPETLDSIQCALSKNRHFVEHPITMSCGHTICKKCIPNDNNQQQLKCLICNELNEHNLNTSKESTAVKTLMRVFLNDLFYLIEDKFNTSIRQLKESKTSFEEALNFRIKFIKDEIEVRIESIKMELDKIYDEIINELMYHKDVLLK